MWSACLLQKVLLAEYRRNIGVKGGGRTVLWSRYFHQMLALSSSPLVWISSGEDFSPEEFPLDVRLPEDPVVGVDHPGAEHTEEDDEGDELVESPEDIARDVRNALITQRTQFDLLITQKLSTASYLLYVIIKLSHHSISSDGAASDQFSLDKLLWISLKSQ